MGKPRHRPPLRPGRGRGWGMTNQRPRGKFKVGDRVWVPAVVIVAPSGKSVAVRYGSAEFWADRSDLRPAPSRKKKKGKR